MKIYVFILNLFVLIFISQCKKEPDPIIIEAQNSNDIDLFTNLNSNNSSFTSNQINRLFYYQSKLYIGTENELVEFDNGSYNFYSSIVKVNDIQLNDSLLFCATDNGLYVVSANDTLHFNIQNSQLPINKIRSIELIDSLLWIGSYSGGGLCKYNIIDQNWEVFTPSNSNLPSNTVSDIAIGNNNDLWLGMPVGLVNMNQNGLVTIYNQSNSSLPNNSINCVKKYNNQIWVGHNGGVSVLESGTITSFTMSNSDLSLNIVSDIYISNNQAFIGTQGQGFDVIDLSNNSFTHYSITNSNISDNYINSITSDGINFYFGTNDGISILNN